MVYLIDFGAAENRPNLYISLMVVSLFESTRSGCLIRPSNTVCSSTDAAAAAAVRLICFATISQKVSPSPYRIAIDERIVFVVLRHTGSGHRAAAAAA